MFPNSINSRASLFSTVVYNQPPLAFLNSFDARLGVLLWWFNTCECGLIKFQNSLILLFWKSSIPFFSEIFGLLSVEKKVLSAKMAMLKYLLYKVHNNIKNSTIKYNDNLDLPYYLKNWSLTETVGLDFSKHGFADRTFWLWAYGNYDFGWGTYVNFIIIVDFLFSLSSFFLSYVSFFPPLFSFFINLNFQ